MFRDRKNLPVFHENDFEEILSKFNLLVPIQNGDLKCSICDILITKENFGCILLTKKGEIKTTCSNPECLENVYQVIQNESE